MRTFSIQTLGCKVNQYESRQLASLLRSHGLEQADSDDSADLRIIHTCSVTIQAAAKSRQTVRQSARPDADPSPARRRTIVTGCWATSNPTDAQKIPGVDAVLGHDCNVADELNRLLFIWNSEDSIPAASSPNSTNTSGDEGKTVPGRLYDDQKQLSQHLSSANRPSPTPPVKPNPLKSTAGTVSLPLLDHRQTGQQRAILKVQDGCDAHCSYCIIPKLRPTLWSKSEPDVIEEARRLTAAGHLELVLTGIFLGAYAQPTALRRRQPAQSPTPLARLVESLCLQVPALRRLRLSSLEPGDLTPDLIATLRSHPQVVPHFHLPLQSGSDLILRRMNRQYRRDDYLRMIDLVTSSFDRPALTTDIIVAFPGETPDEFARTLDVVHHARFIHIHAFPFSPRPGTAAARWTRDFVHGPVANQRINLLTSLASEYSLVFRSQFVGQTVQLLVEHSTSPLRNGRCERYFDVHFDDPASQPGDCVTVRIDRITPNQTWGTKL